MTTESERRVDYLKYINTALLTLILSVAVMIFNIVDKVKITQSTQTVELIRLKTVQEINVSNVTNLTSRVVSLEYDRNTRIEKWVEDNYLRKPQK